MTPDPGRGCSGAEAWQTFGRAHALVLRRVEADLVRAHDLPLVSFDVLERLAGAPDRRLRMAELADLLVVSRSGVTRAVDRLARQGLVTRQPCDWDLRGTYATITREGLARLLAAAPTHQAAVAHHLLRPLGVHAGELCSLFAPVLARGASSGSPAHGDDDGA